MSQGILLVEGKDDEHVFYALLGHFKVSQTFKIKDKKGINNLLESLHVELRGSDLKQLGIVIDADIDLPTRWQRLSTILTDAGYTALPPHPHLTGTIIPNPKPNLPTVGIWIMPNNTLPGMLEDFISFLIPVNDLLWSKAASCLKGIPQNEWRFSPHHFAKAHIHTWLAWQDDPGTPLGLAITKKYLDANSTHAKQFIDWIEKLFAA